MNAVAQRALALAVGTTIGLCTVGGVIAARVYPEIRLERLAPEARDFRQQVLEDLAQDNRPVWAGSYGWSNGYEHHALDISPAGFFFSYSNCQGTPHLAYGAVELAGANRLLLSINAEVMASESERSVLGTSREILCIPWGEEQFMVPVEAIPEFCASAQDGQKRQAFRYSTWLHLLRPGKSSWGSPDVVGLPQVPQEFRHLLGEG